MMRAPLLIAVLSVALGSFAVASAAETTPVAPGEQTSLVGRRLADMLTAGFGRGPNSLKDAGRFYNAARADAKGDPRVEYAYGLVLLKQLRQNDAVAQFQSVTKSQPEYWLAWQAMIWCHFVARDYTTGYQRLTEFARRLVDSQADLSERRQSVEWIGQAIAALQKSVETVKQREALLREDEALKKIFDGEMLPSFASGKASVHMLHTSMEEDLQQTREQVLARQEKERLEREAQVAKDLEATTKNRESLKKSAEESKKYFDEQLAGLDKQLTRLERDYEFLQKRFLSITASQVQLNTEMALLTQQLSNNSRPRQGLLGQAYEQRRSILEAQLIQYQVEQAQTASASMLTTQKAQVLVGQRTATVQQYERSSGQIVQKDASLDKWQDRLKKEGEKLKTPAKGKPAPLANKIQQARSFRTYVELDLVLERDRLLDSFGIDATTPQDAK